MIETASADRIQQFVEDQNAAIQRLAGMEQDQARKKALSGVQWQAKADVGVAAAFFYARVTGRFDADGTKFSFQGDLGGIGIAGGESHGIAHFDVPLEELLDGSVFVTAHFGGLVATGFAVTWSRDFKHLGAYVGPGIGIGAGTMYGSGNFKRS